MTSLEDTRTITTRCDHCGITDTFTTDDLTAGVGDDWEQQCSRYPDCNGDLATVVEVGD